MTKSELYGAVSRIKNYLDIDNDCYPIDIFNICDKISGLKVVKAPFKTRDLRGMLCVANDSSENSVILVNSNRTLIEQNYHCTHEFMHLFGDKPSAGTVLKCYDKVKPNQDAYVEWVANEGAAEFLVPYKVFIPLFSKLYDTYSNYALWEITYGNVTLMQELANKFAVSRIVIKNRIKNLSYEIDQYRNKSDMNHINLLSSIQQSKLNIIPTDYDNMIFDIEMRHFFGFPWDGILSANY